MKQAAKDAFLLGTGFWLLGYIASLLLYATPLYPVMGWIMIAVFTPVTLGITWRYFSSRSLPLRYYAAIGLSWTAIAVVLDYLFIVLLFAATYYGSDVFVYYAITFAVPVCVGWRINRGKAAGAS